MLGKLMNPIGAITLGLALITSSAATAHTPAQRAPVRSGSDDSEQTRATRDPADARCTQEVVSWGIGPNLTCGAPEGRILSQLGAGWQLLMFYWGIGDNADDGDSGDGSGSH